MKLVRLCAAVGVMVLAVAMSACGSSTKTADKGGDSGSNAGALVGVTMPTKSSERWIADGDNLRRPLEKLGYKVDLQYARGRHPDPGPTRSRTRSPRARSC